MRKPEQRMWDAIKPNMAGLDARRIESTSTASGIPDVNYVQGWIELKCLRGWPVREKTIVKVKHFTADQRAFLRVRWAAGGKTFLLLKVAKEWLLFTGPVAAKSIHYVNRQKLYEICVSRWTRLPRNEELRKCLLS